MSLSYKIINSPGLSDGQILDFIAKNDDDFYPPIATRRTLEDFFQSVFQYNGQYVLCYHEDRIVGLAATYLNHPTLIFYWLYAAVDKNYRGQGISTELFTIINEICKAQGAQRLYVKTWSTNLISCEMFKKHGFFHLYTLEDDRSKGVHTHFFVKSITENVIIKPIKRLAIIGNSDNYTVSNFLKTILTIPKTNGDAVECLPVILETTGTQQNIVSIPWLHETIKIWEKSGVTHYLLLDNYPQYVKDNFSNDTIEFIDVWKITCKIVNDRKIKCLYVTDTLPDPTEKDKTVHYKFHNIIKPDSSGLLMIGSFIEEIRTGKVSPAYYKAEIAAIALANDCQGILLANPALHTMFGFDKIYNGLEIFDPWVEIAILIQSSFLKIGPAI